MRILEKCKDGGPDSPVDAYFLFEIKGLLSVALLKFNNGSRIEYHTHAFNALTWFIKGDLLEDRIYESDGELWHTFTEYKRSFLPKLTTRDNLHKVRAYKDSWCFTIRGKWQETWTEYNENKEEFTTLTHGRATV